MDVEPTGAMLGVDLLNRLVEKVNVAASIDDAVALLAEGLHERLALSRVGVRLLRPGTDEIVQVAVWSAMPTNLIPGTVMRVRQTSFTDVVREGRCVIGRPHLSTYLTADIVASEGARAWAAIALPAPQDVRGLLTICSYNEEFPIGSEAFDLLGALLGARLFDLAHASRWHRNEML